MCRAGLLTANPWRLCPIPKCKITDRYRFSYRSYQSLHGSPQPVRGIEDIQAQSVFGILVTELHSSQLSFQCRSVKLEADNPELYIATLPDERKPWMQRLRSTLKSNLPFGFEETMSYGMIGFVVPHKIYPEGYHCDSQLPLPFINIASQKNFIALYHMGIYADQTLLNWFVAEYPKFVKTKLNMGKSCIRFKKPELIPFELIGELAGKMTPETWISIYQKSLK